MLQGQTAPGFQQLTTRIHSMLTPHSHCGSAGTLLCIGLLGPKDAEGLPSGMFLDVVAVGAVSSGGLHTAK